MTSNLINLNERQNTDNSNPRLIRTNFCGPNEFELTRIYCININMYTYTVYEIRNQNYIGFQNIIPVYGLHTHMLWQNKARASFICIKYTKLTQTNVNILVAHYQIRTEYSFVRIWIFHFWYFGPSLPAMYTDGSLVCRRDFVAYNVD